ncbi:MAG TPA: fibronectin type III domain-containing protein [Frankiaceae bacterium]|jgi:hypothetical protein|nr:fibronectin type III domain-containing protein [Frankiaceae bacterium]
MRTRRAAAAIGVVVSATVAVTGATVLPAHAAVRFEAENGTAGPACGDNGQVPSPHATGSGATVVFFGGDGCYVSFSLSSADVASGVRWYGGGQAGEICGTFEVRSGGVERARSNRSCSIGGSNPDDFKVATFASNSLPSGTVEVVWHPETSWHDAHVDWFETTGPTQPTAPGNDHFGAGYTIPGTLPFTTSQSTAGATLQSGEPQPCAPVGGTVWFWWTANSTRTVVADTYGSGYDTVLAVYTGSNLTALTQVGCNDDTSTLQSEVSFTATAGTTYRIQLGGYNGATGTAWLHLNAGASTPGLPTGVSVTAPGEAQLRVSWTAPNDGGSAITEYRVWGASSCSVPLSYVGSVGGSERSLTQGGLEPGLRCYAVSAVNGVGEGGRSSQATGKAYAGYTVELKAYIPHDKVVDPPVYRNIYTEDGHDYGYANSWGGSCNTRTTAVSKVWSWYEGDNHTGYSGSYRVRSGLVFKWDGTTVFDVIPYSGTNPTRRFRFYRDPLNSEACLLRQLLATSGATGSGSGTTFKMTYESENPVAAEEFSSAMSPNISGELSGSFSGNTLTLSYTTNEFPTHAFVVIRNGVLQMTSYVQNASCLGRDDVMGFGGATKLATGLNSTESGSTSIAPSDSGRTASTPSALC